MDNFCRNKYINSYTLKLPSIHIFKSLQIRYVYDVWNSTEWKWQQIPPQSHWEILCQLLENCPVSWGSAWQCFLPHRSASLSAGRWSNYQLGGGARREKGSKQRGKKMESLFLHKTLNLEIVGRPSWSSQLLSWWEIPHKQEWLPNTTWMAMFLKYMLLHASVTQL